MNTHVDKSVAEIAIRCSLGTGSIRIFAGKRQIDESTPSPKRRLAVEPGATESIDLGAQALVA